jgi:hypothetical protein
MLICDLRLINLKFYITNERSFMGHDRNALSRNSGSRPMGDTLKSVTVEPVLPKGLIRDALSGIHAIDKDGRARYKRALKKLRANYGEELQHIVSAERAAPRDAYPFRWALLYLLAEIEHKGALEHLVEMAVREMPKIDYVKGGCEASEEGELLVASMAVLGVERLLTIDRGRAIDGLMTIIEKQGHIAIRSAAVTALLANSPELRSSIIKILPKKQQWIVKLKQIQPEEISAYPDRTDFEAPAPKRSISPPYLPGHPTSPRISNEGDK